MATKNLKTRIQNKHDTEANWAKATTFKPLAGEIIIYDAEYNANGEETQAVRFKIGDGSKTVNNLPFAVIDGIQKISGEFYFSKTEDGSIVGISDRGVMIMSKPNNPSFFIVGKEGDMDLYAALMVQSSGDVTSPSTITIGLGEPTVVQLEGQEAGSAKQVFTSQGDGATPKWTSVVNSLNGNTGDITGIATTSQLDNKQDKITSSNKLSSSFIDGLGAAAGKAVDTVISANSTSTNLPTSKAVEDRINAHSGIDKVGTVTGVKMNGTTKNPSSGVIDIGTVLTDASKFATAAQGTKADNAVPNTRKVNNKALSTDIKLEPSDVGVTESAFPGLKKTGTITGIKMNGASKGTSGVVDLGTVITAHQDISGKQDKITSSNKLSASLVSGLATVATSGSYDDLSHKPTIPTVNNGTLTIQKNGATVGTFTANQKDGTTANITVPTKASDVNALSLDGGTINKSKTIKMDASANSDGANLKWGTVNSKNPYIGYASDQVDGTFVVGSLLGTNYASGLAIGGGSGNLLWKGTKVATTSDIPNTSNFVPKSAFSLSGTTLTITV